jgi:tartrate dehydrogenase/decarboxylase/D-malate dehydrogenase
MFFVSQPERFDVIVTDNLFGDILSDLGPACTGTIGIAPSGNINPEREYPSMFEPVHGSAPDIAGKGVANPLAAILSAAMMLRYSFRCERGAARIEQAVARVLRSGARTADLASGAHAAVGTQAMGDLVIEAL